MTSATLTARSLRTTAKRAIVPATAVGTTVVVAALALTTHSGHEIAAAAFSGNSHELREELLAIGVGGVFALLAVILSHALVPFPTELVSAAAGYVYGFWLGLDRKSVV